jgi:hypothetical protein
MSESPNPVVAAWSIVSALARVARPNPLGTATMHHEALAGSLSRLAENGPAILISLAGELAEYLSSVRAVDPDELTREEALALWINIYNAGALVRAAEAQRQGATSVLLVPGAFRKPVVRIGGEDLSLDDIEHGKLRRFRDPRIHAALVCGSVSCPTLRGEPYRGVVIAQQLDDQMRHFLSSGGLIHDEERNLVMLSRVFLWFGPDFVRPTRMPTILPVRRRTVLSALSDWIEPSIRESIEAMEPRVGFQSYDWGLSCSVR